MKQIVGPRWAVFEQYFSVPAVGDGRHGWNVAHCPTCADGNLCFKSWLCHFATRQMFSYRDCIWSVCFSEGLSGFSVARCRLLLSEASSIWAITHQCKLTLLGMWGVWATPSICHHPMVGAVEPAAVHWWCHNSCPSWRLTCARTEAAEQPESFNANCFNPCPSLDKR